MSHAIRVKYCKYIVISGNLSNLRVVDLIKCFYVECKELNMELFFYRGNLFESVKFILKRFHRKDLFNLSFRCKKNFPGKIVFIR